MSTIRKIALVALTVAVAAACAPTAKNGGKLSGNSASGTVVVAVPADAPGDIALRKAEAKSFMSANPGVKVTVLTIPGETFDQKVTTMIAGGKPPDIFTSGDVVIPTIVQKHFALDLMPLVKRDKYDLSDFQQQVIDGLTYNGQLVGLTDNWDTQVMYYNQTLFDKAGVAVPDESWTWDDFLAAAKKLTTGSGSSKVYGAVFDPWFAPVYDVIWSNGGNVYNQDGTKCALAEPAATQSIQWIADLFKQGVAPSPSQLNAGGGGMDAGQTFQAGRGAMLIGSGRWSAFDFQEIKRFQWKVAPLPKGTAGRANFFHLSMFAIASNSKNQAAAWKFLQYMVSPDGIRAGAKNAQGIPSRKSLVNDPAFTNNSLVTEHDAYQPFLVSLPTVHKAPYVPSFPQLQDKVDAALDAVWAGKKTAADVTPALCADLDKSLAAAKP
jgi:multiple sugar transport system substrate-binding protein